MTAFIFTGLGLFGGVLVVGYLLLLRYINLSIRLAYQLGKANSRYDDRDY